MNLVVVLEHHFVCTGEGAVWTQTQFAYPFWVRYLAVFDRVRVVARIRQVPSAPPDWKRADGPHVSFTAVPDYLGPRQYLLRFREVQRALKACVQAEDAVILRVSSQLANDIEPWLRRTGHPYGVEVVADPYDVFAPGSVKHPLRPLFRWWFPRQLQRQCSRACAAAYVTEHTLQRRYPPGEEAFSTHYSSVELSEQAFVSTPRPICQEKRRMRLVFVGTLAQLYKAPDVLIDAVALCAQGGLDLELVLVGDGKHRAELEAQAAARGIGQRVRFTGRLPSGDAVRAQLDGADLFVLPSYQEGLPRAMIEAMARGLPCIGSTIGGFPELLSVEEMVPPGDAAALAHAIRRVVTNPQRLADLSARNLDKAQNYRDEVLDRRRVLFYSHVKQATETWLEGRRGRACALGRSLQGYGGFS
jgi:glycosyltransferase involved in cell wall biosynthesis